MSFAPQWIKGRDCLSSELVERLGNISWWHVGLGGFGSRCTYNFPQAGGSSPVSRKRSRWKLFRLVSFGGKKHRRLTKSRLFEKNLSEDETTATQCEIWGRKNAKFCTAFGPQNFRGGAGEIWFQQQQQMDQNYSSFRLPITMPNFVAIGRWVSENEERSQLV